MTAPAARGAAGCARLALACLPWIAACGSTNVRPIEETVTKYDRLLVEQRAEFADARAALLAGDAPRARAGFERMWQADPDNVLLGIWLQEAEIACAVPGAAASGAQVQEIPPAVARQWAEAAERDGRASVLVLAARLEADEERAKAWLAAAESRAPDCAWVPFARAHRAAQAASWDLARNELGRAERLDAGNLWVRRLRAWLAARLEGVEQAADELELWLEHAENDPRVLPYLVEGARYDLAVLYVLRDEPSKANAVLERLAGTSIPENRRLQAIACAEQALGDWKRALAAAQASEAIAPNEVLPLVQQALLLDVWMKDRAGAAEAWTRVLAATQKSSDLVDLLQRTRARVRLERLKAQDAAAARPN